MSKNLKRELNRWQFIFHLGYDRIDIMPPFGWRGATIGLLRINSYPPEGMKLSKENYAGFLLEWLYWLPWRAIK